MDERPQKRPKFLRWPWIAVFSGVLIMVAGAIVAIASGESVGATVVSVFSFSAWERHCFWQTTEPARYFATDEEGPSRTQNSQLRIPTRTHFEEYT